MTTGGVTTGSGAGAVSANRMGGILTPVPSTLRFKPTGPRDTRPTKFWKFGGRTSGVSASNTSAEDGSDKKTPRGWRGVRHPSP